MFLSSWEWEKVSLLGRVLMFRLLVLSMTFSWIDLWLVCCLCILYFRNVIIIGDIIKMFRIFRIHSASMPSKTFFVVNTSHTFLFESTILHDHLVYKELIIAVIWFFFASLFGLNSPFFNRCCHFLRCGKTCNGSADFCVCSFQCFYNRYCFQWFLK